MLKSLAPVYILEHLGYHLKQRGTCGKAAVSSKRGVLDNGRSAAFHIPFRINGRSFPPACRIVCSDGPDLLAPRDNLIHDYLSFHNPFPVFPFSSRYIGAGAALRPKAHRRQPTRLPPQKGCIQTA